MDICRLEDYKQLISTYDSCFGELFPELGFSYDDDTFTIKGISRRYEDISGVDLNMDYFFIGIHKEYTILLPISESGRYRIKEEIKELLN